MEPLSGLEYVIDAANTANARSLGDYEKDGLLYCGKCHTPKQCRVRLIERVTVVGAMCACAQAKYEQEEAERQKREEAERIMRSRSTGISSQTLRGAIFEAADGRNQETMAKLHRYAEKWEEMKQENIGLLLYGGVGTGKSYGAACIANYLFERKVPAYMINLSTVLNSLGGFQSEDKNRYIDDLMRYPLLILDDFGMERQTEYALEQVFNVIDARYRSGKPLIVTTNLSLAELKAPKTLEHKRIYDRICQMCLPINFGNDGRRTDIAQAKMKKAVELLQGN